MVKKYFYKGIPEEELSEISLDDFKKIVPARIRRTLERGFTPAQKRLIQRIKKVREQNIQKPLKTQCRSMPVLPLMVGLTIMIHNGKTFTPVKIDADKLGHFLGEFTLTRKRIAHSAPGVGATRSSKFVPLK